MTQERSPEIEVLPVVSLFIAILLILDASAAWAQAPLFLPAVTYPSGGDDVSIAVADVNGDGKPDLLLADYNSGGVDVLLGNGDGTFQNAVFFAGEYSADSVAVADVNGDGKPDVAVSIFNSSTVAILLGNGDGTFQAAVSYDSGGSGGGSCADSVALRDVNGDGEPDVVVTNWCAANFLSKTVDVLLNNGDGTFQAAVSYDSGGEVAESVAVADVNGDGVPDLLVANWWASFQDTSHGSVGVLLGNGDGTFQGAVAYGSGGYGAASVVVGDVNGDGKSDLVVANCEASPGGICSSPGFGRGLVGVLLGNGDGSFLPVVTYDLGGVGAGFVAVADVNGDGKADVLVTSCGSSLCSSAVAVLLGNGDGTLQPAAAYASGGYGAAAVEVADVNGDTKPDLLVATCANSSCFFGEVGVLLNTAADVTPPLVTLSADPKVLWPPNGSLVPVRLSGVITDLGSGVRTSSVEYAVTDEYGLIQPRGHIALDPSGNYSFTVSLRASREDTDNSGRHYWIRVSVRDNAGNRGVKWGLVEVPHERR